MTSTVAGMAATESQSVLSRGRITTSIRATPQANALANSNWFDRGRRFAAMPRATIKARWTAKAARKTIHAVFRNLSFLNAVPVNSRITAIPYSANAAKNSAFMLFPPSCSVHIPEIPHPVRSACAPASDLPRRNLRHPF